MMERDLRRPLTDQEQFLALERARALGMVSSGVAQARRRPDG